MGENATTLAGFLTNVGTIVTKVLEWTGNVSSTIVGDPMLLFTVGFLAIGKPAPLPI